MNSKIIRVFPRRTKWTPDDDLAFVGEPPLFELPNLPVYVSVVFSWDIDEADRISTAWQNRVGDNVSLGGPALEGLPAIGYVKQKDIEFIPGRFIKKGVTITSRGCPKRCPWCLVPKREGKLREINIADGYIVQDNNLLACSRGHIEKVFEMLSRQKKAAQFKGGLDIDYLEAWHVELLKQIRVNEIWVACDRQQDLERLDKAADLLSDFSIEKKRCYVLCYYNGDTINKAKRRLETVYEKGFLPFIQLYKSPEAEFKWCCGENVREWYDLVKKWSRPAIYRSKKAAAAERK